MSTAAPDSGHIFDYLLDARGLYCPEPLMMLHNKVREASIGKCIKVLATDPSTKRDIPKFCHFLGHTLLQSSEEEEGDVFVFFIVKSASDSGEKV